VARRLSEVRRGLKRFPAAREAVQIALASAPDSIARADAWLERARTFRDQGLLDSTLAAYEVAIAAAPDSNRREAWTWERAREFEDAGRWDEARAGFAEIARMARRRASDGVFRTGLMHFIAGRGDSAAAWWANDSSEASVFWRAIALRAPASAGGDGRRARSDSLLGALAARPGYAFYRSAARETLGLRGWTGREVAAAGASREPALMLARSLAALGMSAEAATVLSRWNAGDPRVLPAGARAPRTAATWLEASAAASCAGHAPLAIVLAERAAVALEDSGAARSWAAVPWAYPPAFDSLVLARPEGLEPALLWAVMRQESRFDPRARSASAALGLMQLKIETAGDMAKLMHARPPAREEDLFDPALNLRYGALYLRRMLERFDGRLAVALSAYNAGPSTIPPFWRELVARGGEALFIEIASNADAQNYARKISANRSAYRELRPAVSR
jgi:soluble lytic murein transglycosylase